MIPVTEKNATEVAKAVKEHPVQSPGTVRRSLSITQLAMAMVAVQKQIEDPTKNKKADAGTRGSYRYADLPTVLDVARPALVANGFAVMQFPCELDDAPALTTLLIHSSGEWVETTAKIRPVDPKPQNVGSALTYARRYALLALCGIAADDDDDGKAAGQPRPQQAQQPRPAPVPADYAKRIVAALANAKSRAEGGPIWNEFDGFVKAGRVSAEDKAAIDAAFKEFGTRFPAQSPAKQ